MAQASHPELISRRSYHSPAREVADRVVLERISLDLLAPLTPAKEGVRLLGVTLSALRPEEERQAPQLSLAL